MSGIFGFWRLDGRPAGVEALREMSAAMPHRGPDGVDTWAAGPVAIGHLHFRTTPEAQGERQPLVVADGGLVLTADARIDNRVELLGALGLDRRPAADVSDAALILAAYERWGSHCMEQLLGDFAFAIWDARRQALVCARDHFGIRPLHWFHLPGRLFAFASEIKALRTLPEVSDEIDELEVARHLVIPVEDDLGATYYRDVRKVKPAHELTVRPDGMSERRYWSLDPDRSLVLRSDEEYAEAVRERFLEAVRCRLRASGKVASMLSGGLDSSSITCAAAGMLEECGHEPPLLTLSAVYDRAAASDEREFMDEVVRACGVHQIFFSADSVSPIAEIDEMNRHIDGANDAGNLYLNWNLYRMAADHDVSVVLDGFDGDTTLSHGVGRFVELAHRLRWWTLAREVSAYAKNTGYPRVEAARWALTHGIKPAIRTRLGRADRNGGRKPKLGAWANTLQNDYRDRVVPRLATLNRPPKTEREEHHRLLERSLMVRAVSGIEAVGAGAGVEVRLPFFDVRLVELCLSLPADQKLRKGWSRLVMRNAMQGILPEKIRWRAGKADVSIGFRQALQTLGTPKVEEVMESTNEELGRFVNTQFLRDTLPRFMAGEVSMQEDVRFWKVFSLALWLMGRSGAGNVDDGSHSIAYGSSTIRRRQTQEEVASA